MILRIDKSIQRLGDIAGKYESPPEEMLGERLFEAIAPGVSYSSQVWIETVAGRFRLDMLLVSTNGQRIGIEVAGREYHDPSRDLWRTVFILCAGEVDAILRVPAASVYSNLVGVLAGLAAIEPELFLMEFKNRWQEAIQAREYRYDESAADDRNGFGDDELSFLDHTASSSGPHLHRWEIMRGSRQALSPYVEFIRSAGLRNVDSLAQAWKDVLRPAESKKKSGLFSDLFDEG